MKKLIPASLTTSLILIVILFFSKGLNYSFALENKKINVANKILSAYDKIIATHPSTISEKQFYKYESDIIVGFSGSGGYFLNNDGINWILKAEDIFNKKGIKLKDKEHRHSVIAWSYFHSEQYGKALKELNDIKDQSGVELVEWVVNNSGIKNGIVKIKEYKGKIPDESSEGAKIENDRYLFISYFKGPVYRYDKLKNLHALIYAPGSQYDWCDDLKLQNGKLVIRLGDIDGTSFVFDNTTHKLSQLNNKISAVPMN